MEKQVFSGYPHCNRCGNQLTAINEVVLTTPLGTKTIASNYVCEQCLTTAALICYLDPNLSCTKDIDGSRIKPIQTSFFVSYNNVADTKQKVDA